MTDCRDGSGDPNDPSKIVYLWSKDGVSIPVSEKLIRKSVVISRLLDDLPSNPTSGYVQIPVSDVDSNVLVKVISFLEHHANDASYISPYMRNIEEEELDPFDRALMDIELKDLIALTLAAHYLNVKKLFALCCKTVTSLIKGKTASEMRTILQLKNDVASEEFAQVSKDNLWSDSSYNS